MTFAYIQTRLRVVNNCFYCHCGDSGVMCALRTWLANKLDIPTAHGPDHEQSLHAYEKVDYEPLFEDLAMQAACAAPYESTTATSTKEQLLALRMVAYELSTDHLEVLTSLLLGGRMPFNFLHDHWQSAVQDYLDGKPLIEVFTVQSFKYDRLTPSGATKCPAH